MRRRIPGWIVLSVLVEYMRLPFEAEVPYPMSNSEMLLSLEHRSAAEAIHNPSQAETVEKRLEICAEHRGIMQAPEPVQRLL